MWREWAAAWLISASVVCGAKAQSESLPGVPMSGLALKSRLESVFKDKRMPIRDFLADPVMRYRWQNGHLEHDSEHVFTFGLFTLESVAVSPENGPVESVVLKGVRGTLLKDGKGGYGVSSVKEAVRFEVDLRGAEGDLSTAIAAQLFYSSVLVQLSAVPPYISGPVEAKLQEPKVATQGTASGLTWVADGDVWKEVPKSEVTMLKVSFVPEAKFTEQARKDRVSGVAEVGLIVSPTGSVDRVWIYRPLGSGLTVSVIEAAFKYRFTPAKYQGHSVATPLSIEMNFASY